MYSRADWLRQRTQRTRLLRHAPPIAAGRPTHHFPDKKLLSKTQLSSVETNKQLTMPSLPGNRNSNKKFLIALAALFCVQEGATGFQSFPFFVGPRRSLRLFFQPGSAGPNTTFDKMKNDVSQYSLNSGAPGSQTVIQMSTAAPPGPTKCSVTGPVHSFSTPALYLDALDDNEHDDELLVVKYYATYCKVCQRASINYKKIATDRRDQPVRFAKLECSRLHADILRELGLSKFPFIQVFRHGACVASFSTGPSHMFNGKVRDTVDMCLARSDDEWHAFEKQFSAEIQANRDAREKLRKSLRGEAALHP